MKKICKVCNDEFTTPFKRLYCSSKCQRDYRFGVFIPDPNKKYKHQLTNIQGHKWSSKCYN